MGPASNLHFVFNQHVLDPKPPLEVAFSKRNGLPFYETLHMASSSCFRLPSNAELTVSLLTGRIDELLPGFPCRTGTLAAYEGAGIRLGKKIEFHSSTGPGIVFQVWDEFVGKKDIVIIAEFPDFSFKLRGDTLNISPIRCQALSFPKRNGVYPFDPDFGIPTGLNTRPECGNASHLRRSETAWVGLVARHLSLRNPKAIIVDVAADPSKRLGLFKQITQTGLASLEQLPGFFMHGGPYRSYCEGLPPEAVPEQVSNDGLLALLKRTLGF